LFSSLISFDEALQHVLAGVRPIERTETLAVADAHGRVAAKHLVSGIDVPSFDRSAMDGYAVRSVDLRRASAETPVALRCVDRVLTGQVPVRALNPGECIEVATGAPLPADADAVVIVERTSRREDLVTIAAPIAPGQNAGRRGGDVTRGSTIVRTGDLLTPARLGALAAIGVTTIDVYARPSVALVVTGNEIVEPPRELPPGHVYDVNSFTLRAIVGRHGGAPAVVPPVGDDVDALRGALSAAAVHDLVVCSGGSSVGARDLLIDAVTGIGDVVFHGIAMKPGKPTLFGSIGATPLFGMPGNPTSCLSNAYLLLVPFLRAFARLPAWRPTRVVLPLARALASPSDRHQFFTVRLVDGGVEPAFKSSGDITSMAGADGFIEIPANSGEMPVGTPVTVTLFQSE
jgi:molybdenum cofactor synthesis domain-containing protein